MIDPVATVVIPTFNHGTTLGLAVKTALNQTVPIEIFIIGDGVPESSRAMISSLATNNPNIRFFDHPKHISRGEPYRHAALQEARGRIVCYLCDRDLWLPNHVERMAVLLESADFAHSLSLHILPEKSYCFFPVNLTMAEHRLRMLTRFNRVAFSCAAHTLAFYRRLERGWETTPPGKPTDWHMFQQFLANEDCRCASSNYPSAITFPSPPRLNWSEEQRIAELQIWAARLTDNATRQTLVQEILEAAILDRDGALAETYEASRTAEQMLADLYQSPLWRLRQKILSIPGVRPLKNMLYKLNWLTADHHETVPRKTL
jgi:glycosyltransferase involved in cell wall biosynthesis